MDLFDTTQLALQRAAAGASLRQQTLAENLANANTPGYRRRDVDFHAALEGAMDGGKDAIDKVSFAPEVDRTAAVRGDGSNVDLDRESSALSQTGLEYDALTQIIKSRMSILRAAIGGGGS
ncbi:MAG: flagellar basal body rod protein FlgB [Solirubrobacteraceae bacterium]|nr:flagellar basal body rod protein FlgB [Solirubrobacteraceae bacterium]